MSRVLPFNDMAFSRNSDAWCPVTGRAAGLNVPRVAERLVLEHQAEARLYHRFPVDQGFTAYAPGSYERPGETTDYALELLDAFTLEWAVAGGERITLGYSYEGREIPAWRLGPVDRPHFLVTGVVHGNEVDGVPGSIEGMRILATHPDFAALRERFTLFFIPICNPDGYHHHTRGVAKLGPNPYGVDQRINLNRVWPWFWQEYQPSTSESKGAVPLDCPEAQAIYQWWRTGNGGQPVPIAWAIDQHSTAGDGARYQSRDRCFREYPEGDWFSMWADWIVWRQLRGIQAERVRKHNAPDLWINYFRSRFKPHLHPFWGTRTTAENGGQAPISLVTEHNKVAFVAVEQDQETYQSACDYNFDVLIAAAQVAQGDAVEARDAVLIEHETGNNLWQNSEWNQWQKAALAGVPDYRPGYWTGARLALQEARGQGQKHMQYHGAALRTEGNLLLDLPEGYEFQEGRVAAASLPDQSGALYLYFDASVDAHHLRRVTSNTVAGSVSDLALFDLGAPMANSWPLLFAGSASTAYVVSWNTGNCEVRRFQASTGWIAEVLHSVASTPTDARYLYNAVQDGSTAWWCDGAKRFVLNLDTGALTTAAFVDAQAAQHPVLFRAKSGANAGRMFRLSNTLVSGQTYQVQWLNDAGSVVATASCAMPTDVSWTLGDHGICGAAVYDDASQVCRIYGAGRGVYPFAQAVDGIVKIAWDGAKWVLSLERPTLATDESQDTHDEGDYPDYSERLTQCGAVLLKAADSPALLAYILGGIDLDAGAYPRRVLVHDWSDNAVGLGLDETYGYLRYNIASDATANKRFSTTWSVRANEDSIAGYVRITNSPGESASGTLTRRRVRNYYSLPPRWWVRYQGSVVVGRGPITAPEDECRHYLRVYREAQGLWMDSPMLVASSWPSSWSPYGMTRQTEVATWNSAIACQWFRVRLTWLPAACFLAANARILLVRIGPASGERLELWSTGDSSNGSLEREYNLNDVYGSHEPGLELRRYADNGTYVACSVPVYWGGYVKDVSCERFDTPLTIELWQHAALGFGLTVKNGPCVGYAHVDAPFSPGASTWGAGAAMDLSLLGGGWWCEPEVLSVTREELAKLADGKGRNGALLIGDRDPSFGLVTAAAAFRYVEDFSGGDLPRLGESWTPIGTSAFERVGGSAQHTGNNASAERWNARPGLRDCEIRATARLYDAGGLFGLYHSLDWLAAGAGNSSGYLANVVQTSDGPATLYLCRVDNGAMTVLASQTILGGVASEAVHLRLSRVGADLVAQVLSLGDSQLAQVSAQDVTYARPGAFGIYANGLVDVYEVLAVPNAKTRITEE